MNVNFLKGGPILLIFCVIACFKVILQWYDSWKEDRCQTWIPLITPWQLHLAPAATAWLLQSHISFCSFISTPTATYLILQPLFAHAATSFLLQPYLNCWIQILAPVATYWLLELDYFTSLAPGSNTWILKHTPCYILDWSCFEIARRLLAVLALLLTFLEPGSLPYIRLKTVATKKCMIWYNIFPSRTLWLRDWIGLEADAVKSIQCETIYYARRYSLDYGGWCLVFWYEAPAPTADHYEKINSQSLAVYLYLVLSCGRQSF